MNEGINEFSNESNKEQIIRNHFKTLSPTDIADSYLLGVNFDEDPLDEILGYVVSLYYDVKDLQRIVASDFGKNSEEKVLLPSSRETQGIVCQNLYHKESALSNIISNQVVLDAVVETIKQRNKEEKNTK